MPGLVVPDCMGGLTIGGVDMINDFGAWCVLDLTPLWENADVRGENVLVPGSAGVIANPKRRTITDVPLDFVLCGKVDRLGADQADQWQGLDTNLRYLRTNVVDPTGVGDGTRPAVLTSPDGGSSYTGDVHVMDLSLGVKAEGLDMINGGRIVVALATLTLSIPDGVLT